jgi:hypothetical protein
MGGQACVADGAAEFGRDIDVAVSVAPGNLSRLQAALRELGAVQLFSPGALGRGHACHFRCHARGLAGIRLDVMSVLRGADPFDRLWRRRRSIHLPGIGRLILISLCDLVLIKKTHRDRDWPMIVRLVEADIVRKRRRISRDDVKFWLQERRTVDRLQDHLRRFPRDAWKQSVRRPVSRFLIERKPRAAEKALRDEQRREMALDRMYRAPLRAELEQWRLRRAPSRSGRPQGARCTRSLTR